MTLTLKYRPKTFSDVVGQGHVVPVLRAFVAGGQPPPVLVFAGSHGTGKTSAARIYAAALNCPNQAEGDCCGQCGTCEAVQKNMSESTIEIDAASHGGVSDVQNIREICMYTHFSDWRVIIIDEAQALSRDAFHALLKIFEEPPERTVFLLLTTEPEKVLNTVKSRAVSFEFKAIPKVEVAKRIASIAKNEAFDLSPILAARIASLTGGHLRDAVVELEKCVQVGIKTDEEYRKFVGELDVSMPIIAASIYGDLAKAYQFVDDFFTQSSDLKKFIDQLSAALVSVSRAYVGIPSAEGVVEIARSISKETLAQAITIIWGAYDRLHASNNPKSIAQVTVTALVQTMATYEPETPEITVKEGSRTIIDTDRIISIEEAVALLD